MVKNQNNNAKKQNNSKYSNAKKNNSAKMSGTAIFMIVFAIVAVIGITVSIVAAIIASIGSKPVDYFNDRLSKYVYISESDYKNFTATSLADSVSELDIQNALIQALCANKNKTALEGGKYLKNQTVTVGDVLYIYYRGYTLDESGNKIDFDGGCNFAGDIGELEIGSGAFVPGFELNLIGKNPKDYSTFTRLDSTGTIGENDLIFVTYKRQLSDSSLESIPSKLIDLSDPDVDEKYGIGFKAAIVGQSYGAELDFSVEGEMGQDDYIDLVASRATKSNSLIRITYSSFMHDGTVSQSKTAMIDLTNPKLDDTWGVGFSEFFKESHPVGQKLVDDAGQSVNVSCKVEDGTDIYYNVTIDYIFEVGDNPLTIEAYFPTDYNTESLRGVTTKFDVYIRTAQLYEAPEFDEKFITETLKLTADDLAEYNGETLTDKYMSMLEAQLVEEFEDAVENDVATAMWEHYTNKVKVKKLPKKEVQKYYDQYVNDITTQYASYTSYYSSVDDFAISYMGLSSGTDWRAVLYEDAEKSVTQKLVFYYVIREEGLIPTDEEYQKLYDKMVADMLESYLASSGVTRDKYKTDAEYDAAVAKSKTTLLSYYTDDYFRENVYFEYAIKTIKTWAEVKMGEA